MPLAKKPTPDRSAPIAPMLAGQQIHFDASPPAPIQSATSSWSGSTKQDGMFRNSTVNDFTGVVNVNPLSGHGANRNRANTSGSNAPPLPPLQFSSPPRPPTGDWAVDPALMGSEPDFSSYVHDQPMEHEEYDDAADAMKAYAYYQSTSAHAPTPPEQTVPHTEPHREEVHNQSRDEPDIDPMLEQGIAPAGAASASGAISNNSAQAMEIDPALAGHTQAMTEPAAPPVMTNGVGAQHDNDQIPNGDSSEASHDDQSNGIIPSTEGSPHKRHSSREMKLVDRFAPEASTKTPAKRRRSSQLQQTPLTDRTSKTTSPKVARSKRRSKTPSQRPELNGDAGSPSALEEVEDATKKLIEQMRQGDLMTKGLRRRS